MAVTNDERTLSASVRAQLERILASDHFARSERMRGLLRFLVEETLAGRAERLKGFTLAVEVFDRDETFDPQVDSLVRAAAGRLRRRLAQYALTDGRQDAVRIELPTGSYVPTFEHRRADPGDVSAADPGARATPVREPSIAVLPFDNLSSDPEQEYFSDGITEEIITELSRLRDLRVIARNTTFRYKRQPVDVAELGRELGVGYVLEGSVRKATARIRVTAQLLEASGGTHLWAETYDRELSPKDILSVQDDIARRVVGAIGQPAGVIFSAEAASARRAAADSLEAYDLVLRWHAYDHRTFEPGEHLRLRHVLERVVEREPGYAKAHAALAALYLDEYRMGFNPRADSAPLDRALASVERALDLDTRCAVARQQLFLIHFHRGDLDRFQAEGERTVAFNPNHADSLADFGLYLVLSGHPRRGIDLLEQALALNPYPSSWYFFALAFDCYRQHAYDQALAHMLEVQFTDFFWTWAFLAMIYAQLDGRDAETRDATARLLELDPQFPQHARCKLGRFHVPPAMVEHCLEGWRKAGLEVV